jgi:hypothetical protein
MPAGVGSSTFRPDRRESVLRSKLIAVLIVVFAASVLAGPASTATKARDAASVSVTRFEPRAGRAPLQPFAYQYTVRSATWRSSAQADGTEESPQTVYRGSGTVSGGLASGGGQLANLAYYPSSGGAGVIVAILDLTEHWEETLEFTGDPREVRSCQGNERERPTLRILLRMAPRSRRVVATYRVVDPHLQMHTDRSGRYCSVGVLPPTTEGRSTFDVGKFLARRTILVFEGHNRPLILGSDTESSITAVRWGFAITLERR